MHLPRLRFRTLMITVAVVGQLCAFWSEIVVWLEQLVFGVYAV